VAALAWALRLAAVGLMACCRCSVQRRPEEPGKQVASQAADRAPRRRLPLPQTQVGVFVVAGLDTSGLHRHCL
jgi:hypothetical protein